MAFYDLAGTRREQNIALRKQNMDLITNFGELGFKKWQQEQLGQNGMPIMTFGADGTPQVVGYAPKGARIVPPAQMQTPEQKQAMELETAGKKNLMPTADMKNALKQTQQAGNLVKSLLKKSETLKGGYEGMTNIAIGAVNRGQGKQADYRTYLSNMPSAAVSVYRAVTGDSRLSDADAQSRALPMMWHPSEHIDTRSQKNQFISDMIMAREVLLNKNQFTTDEETGSAVTDFGQVQSLAEKISMARAKGISEDKIKTYLTKSK
jgi:hypothetical protein